MNIDVHGQNFLKSHTKTVANVFFLSAMKNDKSIDSSMLNDFKNKQLIFVGVTPDADIVKLLSFLKTKDLITNKSKINFPKSYSDLDSVYKQFPKQSVFEILCFMEGYSDEFNGIFKEFLFSIMVRKNL